MDDYDDYDGIDDIDVPSFDRWHVDQQTRAARVAAMIHADIHRDADRIAADHDRWMADRERDADLRQSQ